MPQIVSCIVDVYVFRRIADRVEFLLLKRAPSCTLGGTWQSVHGSIEPPETAWQAALRELKEETQLAPAGFWQCESINTFYCADTDSILMCPCFAAEVAPDAVVRLCAEHTEYRWEPADRALREYMWPGQRTAVREILELIIGRAAAEPHLRIARPAD